MFLFSSDTVDERCTPPHREKGSSEPRRDEHSHLTGPGICRRVLLLCSLTDLRPSISPHIPPSVLSHLNKPRDVASDIESARALRVAESFRPQVPPLSLARKRNYRANLPSRASPRYFSPPALIVAVAFYLPPFFLPPPPVFSHSLYRGLSFFSPLRDTYTCPRKGAIVR